MQTNRRCLFSLKSARIDGPAFVIKFIDFPPLEIRGDKELVPEDFEVDEDYIRKKEGEIRKARLRQEEVERPYQNINLETLQVKKTVLQERKDKKKQEQERKSAEAQKQQRVQKNAQRLYNTLVPARNAQLESEGEETTLKVFEKLPEEKKKRGEQVQEAENEEVQRLKTNKGFGKGKSCIFKLDMASMLEYISDYALVVEFLDIYERKDIIGKSMLSLKMFLEEVKVEIRENRLEKFRRHTFKLTDKMKKTVGWYDMSISITQKSTGAAVVGSGSGTGSASRSRRESQGGAGSSEQKIEDFIPTLTVVAQRLQQQQKAMQQRAERLPTAASDRKGEQQQQQEEEEEEQKQESQKIVQNASEKPPIPGQQEPKKRSSINSNTGTVDKNTKSVPQSVALQEKSNENIISSQQKIADASKENEEIANYATPERPSASNKQSKKQQQQDSQSYNTDEFESVSGLKESFSQGATPQKNVFSTQQKENTSGNKNMGKSQENESLDESYGQDFESVSVSINAQNQPAASSIKQQPKPAVPAITALVNKNQSISYAQESVAEEYADDFEDDGSQPNLSVSNSRGVLASTSVKRNLQEDIISEYDQEATQSVTSSVMQNQNNPQTRAGSARVLNRK